MKKGLFVFAVLAGMATGVGIQPATAATWVTNNIMTDQTWTSGGSPYYICYWDFTVLAGVTLTINPGVVVVLGKGEEIAPGVYLGETFKVAGTLIADRAAFTSTNPVAASWACLRFLNSSVGRLTNCVIQYGGSGAVTYGLVHVSGTTDLEFVGCTFRLGEYEGDSGVHIHDDATGQVRFANCLFTNLNIGVTTERDSGVDVEMDGCTFNNLRAYGTLLRNRSAMIRNCVFRNIQDIDVVLWESYGYNWWCKTANLVGNQFYAGGKATFPVLMYGAVNFSATNNTLIDYSATNSGVRVGGGVPKGRSAVWSASDMDYILPETVLVDGDASSLGTLTIQAGNTVRLYPNAALRVWGNIVLAGTPFSRVRVTSALSAPAGTGLRMDGAWGQASVAYSDFTALNDGVFVGFVYTPTVRVTIAHSTFSNITGRTFDLADAAGRVELRVRDSTVTEAGISLHMDRGGLAAFSNVVFRNTGYLRAVNWANVADFVNCDFIGLRKLGATQPISGGGWDMTFRRCTVVGGEGEGISLTGGRMTDCIVWGHREQALGSTTITASYCCIEGGYIGPGSNNLNTAPGFIGWSGAATVHVDAAASCPGSGTPADPYCSLSETLRRYRDGYNYGLAVGSPCIGAASDGGNIGADRGVGAAGAASLEVRLAAGTYGLGGRDLLMGVSLIGAGPATVTITNTIKGLQSGARLEGVTVASTENQGLEIYGPRSPSIGNCVFSNLTNNAIYIYNAYSTAVDPCAPTITAVRIRDLYSPSAPLRGIYMDGRNAVGKTTPVIRNSLFHRIESGGTGPQGAVHAWYASPTLENCTFFTNRIGLCCQDTGTATVWNCVLYQNRDTDIWNYEGRLRIGCSDYGRYSTYGTVSLWATNNISLDPLFVNRAAFDLRLLPDSPCINRGTNQPWMVGAVDFFGNPRILHRFVDMGAYEHLYQWPMIGVAPTSALIRAATTDPIPDWPFEVWNAGAGTLNYTIATNAPWMSVAPTAGTSTGEVDVVTVSFASSDIPLGTHTGLVTVSDAAASNSPQNVRIILQREAPAIRRNPTNLTVNVAVGGTTTSRTFAVWNGTIGTMNYVLTTNVPWLTVTPTSGTSTGEQDTITLDFDTAALPLGTYSGAVIIASAEATNSPQLVNVTLRVLAPSIACSPTGFSAAVAPGASWPDQVLWVWNGTLGVMHYTVTTNVNWLSVWPGGGTSTGEQDAITVSFRTDSLPEGVHTGLIVIASAEATNSPRNVPVVVNVLDFNRALNTTNLPWRSGGHVPWFLQTAITHDGVEAAQSGRITHRQTSWVEVAVSGPSTLSYWWRVSSEDDYDFLQFYVDDNMIESISGESGWQARIHTIPDGAHVARWVYVKDEIVSSGSDAGWLDEVRYVYDSDGDGLPDLWEQRYWGDPVSTNDCSGDNDGDTFNNCEEFWADTNPTNHLSFPRISDIQGDALTRVDLTPTSTQRLYDIASTTNLLDGASWTLRGMEVRGTGTNLSFWLTNGAPVRFFRSRVRLP